MNRIVLNAVQSRLLIANQPAIPMIEPKRVLRALAEHWALLEPLCEHFDQGTLSLNELRTQLAAQQLDSTPQDITNLLDVWIRLDILVPVAKSPNRFELNAQIHDFLAYLRREHRLGLCLEIEAYLRHLERLAGYIQDAFDIRDGNDLARQLRLLDMRVRDVLKKLDNDEQALVAVAERAKTSDRQIPLRQRYAEVLATWDEYVEPMIDLVNADGAFEQGVRKVETVLLKMLSEQQRLGHLVDDDMLLRTHARILEMQTSAQLTLRHASFESAVGVYQIDHRLDVFVPGRQYFGVALAQRCLLYTSPSPRDGLLSRMPSSA